jgi:hypothetical protein
MEPPPQIGPQDPESPYSPGKVFKIGGHAEYVEVVSYPLDPGVVDILTCIADNIILPDRVLTRGLDFFVRDNTLFFLRDSDPFESSNFPTRVSDGDEEVLLWTSNSLIDKDYVYEHIGYALSIRRPRSTPFYKRMLNGLWDMYNMGTPISWFTSGLGAMLGEPTIQTDGEVVELILDEAKRKLVITDKAVYAVHKDATLRGKVVIGAALDTGEFLTETLRLYDTLDPMKLTAVSEFGERMRTDAYSLFFGRAFFESDLKLGLGASWESVPITKDGVDGNGDAQLRFKLYGLDSDIETFWSDFWARAEAQGYSSETCFQEYLDATVLPVDGSVYGRISPLEYFMRYFLRGNAMIIMVERDKLALPDPDNDAFEALNYLKEVIPAHVAVFIIEQRNVGPETYDLDVVDPDAADYDELGGTRHTLAPTIATTTAEIIREGGPSATAMTYTVRPPIIRWIPTCKE